VLTTHPFYRRDQEKVELYLYSPSGPSGLLRVPLHFNWIGPMLSSNCLLEHVVKGKIKGIKDVRGRQIRRRKQLLGDVKEKRGPCNLK
jgi:hypothetical protein